MSAKSKKKGMNFPLLMGGAIIIFAIFWTLYWFFTANVIQKGAEDWIKTQRASGLEIVYDDLKIVGYPYRFSLEVTNPVIASPVDDLSWKGEKLQLVAMAWKLSHIIAKSPGENRVLGQNGKLYTLTFAPETAASFILENWKLSRANLDLRKARLFEEYEQVGTVERLTFAFRPMPEMATNLQMSLQMAGVELAQALPDAPWLGPSVQTSLILAEAENGYTLFDEQTNLRDWQREGNKVFLRRAELDWGPLDVGAKGSVDFDAAGYPEGVMQLRIERADELRASLAAAGLMTEELRASINTLEFMSRDNGFAPFTLKDRSVQVLGRSIAEY